MGERAPFSQYDRFASIYDSHFGIYAEGIVPVLERLLFHTLSAMSRILDVCCGTGRLAAVLTDLGFVVTGVDGSAEMLRIARRNAPGAEFVLDDVCTFDELERFDAAVSTFDSINHILEHAELRATFTNVCRALRPGGRFVFDVNMEEGYRRRWAGTFHGADNGREFTIQVSYCPETQLGRNLVTWRPVDRGCPEQITFVERCYSEEVLRDALTAAGFSEIEVYDGQRDLELANEGGRSFFVCRKPSRERTHPEPDPRDPQSAHRSGDGDLGSCLPAETSRSKCRRRVRGIRTCVDDALWPCEFSRRELGAGSRRLEALEEVLTTLPPEPYEQLKSEASRFDWFIPDGLVLGQVYPFRTVADRRPTGTASDPSGRIVYLSPLLERQDWPVVVTVVVHELTHVILNHRLLDLDRATYDSQEEEVRHVVREWGFQEEADRTDEIMRYGAFPNVIPGTRAESSLPVTGKPAMTEYRPFDSIP